MSIILIYLLFDYCNNCDYFDFLKILTISIILIILIILIIVGNCLWLDAKVGSQFGWNVVILDMVEIGDNRNRSESILANSAPIFFFFLVEMFHIWSCQPMLKLADGHELVNISLEVVQLVESRISDSQIWSKLIEIVESELTKHLYHQIGSKFSQNRWKVVSRVKLVVTTRTYNQDWEKLVKIGSKLGQNMSKFGRNWSKLGGNWSK